MWPFRRRETRPWKHGDLGKLTALKKELKLLDETLCYVDPGQDEPRGFTIHTKVQVRLVYHTYTGMVGRSTPVTLPAESALQAVRYKRAEVAAEIKLYELRKYSQGG